MPMSKTFEYPKSILIKAGMWPKTDNYSPWYNLRTIFNMGSILMLTLCLIYNAYFQIGDFVMLSKSLYMLISVLNSFLKILTLSFKEKAFLKLLSLLDTVSFKKFENLYQQSISDFMNIVRKVEVSYRIQVNGTVIFLSLFPVWESKSLPMDFPYFNNGTLHYPFYIFESASLIIAAYNNMAIDLLTVGLIAIAAIQLRVLNEKLMDTNKNVANLSNFTEENRDELTLGYLKECCIHYSDIEEYVTCLVDVFSLVVFFQLGTSVVAICNSGMMILAVEPVSVEAVSLFFYITTMFAQLGMYCWFGNFVYMESLQVNTASYMSEWYEYKTATKKMLFMLMERSKRPLQIRGLQLVPLSFNTFISILKWSYSYFALLRHYTLKNNN